MLPQDNPLLDFSGLPQFERIKPEHVTPAIEQLLADGRATVQASLKAKPTWDDFIAPLEDANERLGRAWGQVAHLHAVMDDPPLREAYNANLPKITQYWTELGQNLALFEKYKALHDSREFSGLSSARKKIIENALRDFRLGGAELPEDKKKRYAAISEQLAALSAKFSENLLDATNAFSIVVDKSRVAGIPGDVLEAAREAAQKHGKDGYKFTLHAPSYLPVLQYADDRKLRETLYHASATRAAEFGRPEWDNAPLIARIVPLRREMAQLLGYRDFAEVSLVPKMAESPSQVLAFLEDLARRARPFAEQDAAELREFAKKELGLDPLESWDVGYASEKLRLKRYSFSDQEVKQYFPEEAAIGGLFRVAERLYGVKIVPAKAPLWHPDVRFYEVREAGGEAASQPVGQFYMDLYAREDGRCHHPAAQARPAAASGRLPQLQLLAPGRRQAGALHPRRSAHPVPRGRPRPAPPAHAHRGPRRVRHQRRRVGRGRAAEPVHGELLLGVGRAARNDTARRHGVAFAKATLRSHDRGQEFPERPRHASPDRVLGVRHAPALGLRSRDRPHRAGAARGSARAGGGAQAAGLQPLPEQLLAHLRRRLRGGLLQL
jgi:Zn-dependent oligopeptidase